MKVSAKDSANRLRTALGKYTDYVQQQNFDDAEGFLFFLCEPRRGGKDFVRVELLARDDGTWDLRIEAAPALRHCITSSGFTLAPEDVDDDTEDLAEYNPLDQFRNCQCPNCGFHFLPFQD